MIRTVALLALIASASAFWPFDSEPTPWKKGFARTFSINPLAFASKLPQTLAQAKKEGWVVVQGPTTSTGYDNLKLMIKPSDCTTGVYYDDDNVAGALVALSKKTTELCFDSTEQGLLPWTCSANGENYLTSVLFFVPEDKSARVYNEDEIIQDKNVAFISTGGKLDYVPKDLNDIKKNDTSVWIKQNCLPWMGLHYYHSMTTATTCDKPFVPYFGLYDYSTNQLIGVGFMTIGKCVEDTCEHPSTAAVELIVNNGPKCLYEMVDKCEACTRHYYFVDNPPLITC